MLLMAAGLRPRFCTTTRCAALVVPSSCVGNWMLVGNVETIGPTESPVRDFRMPNVRGVPALVAMVTVPDVLLSAAPSRIRLHSPPAGKLDPQLPPMVKLLEGTMELIVNGTLLTLRKVSRGLTCGDRVTGASCWAQSWQRRTCSKCFE